MANCNVAPENPNCVCTIVGSSRVIAPADLFIDVTQPQHLCCGRVNTADRDLSYVQEDICIDAGWSPTTYQQNLRNHWQQIYNRYPQAEYLPDVDGDNWFRCSGEQIVVIDINGNRGAICAADGFQTDNLLWCANSTRLFTHQQGQCRVGNGIITCPLSSFNNEIPKTIETTECVGGEKTCGICPNNTVCINGLCGQEQRTVVGVPRWLIILLIILALLFIIAIIAYFMM